MPRIIGPVLLISIVAACGGTDPEGGTLVVSIMNTGIDISPGHTVTVDEMPPKLIPIDGSRELVLSAGEHLVRIHGIAGNCASSLPGVQPVTIRDGEIAHLDYVVSCTPRTGFIRLQTTTTGQDLDPDGYIAYTGQPDPLFFNGTWVGTNGEAIMGPIGVGDHDLLLQDLEKNCAIVGNNPRRVTVPKGVLARETVTVSVAITCVAKAP